MRLLRPSHLREGYITDKYTTEYIHPGTGYGALALPEEETVPVHIEADGAELNSLLTIFVEDGGLTQEEADSISQQIIESAGQQIKILDFVPQSWQQYVLTYEQMDADGWFPTVEEGV
jgi:hypothetical protein